MTDLSTKGLITVGKDLIRSEPALRAGFFQFLRPETETVVFRALYVCMYIPTLHNLTKLTALALPI